MILFFCNSLEHSYQEKILEKLLAFIVISEILSGERQV